MTKLEQLPLTLNPLTVHSDYNIERDEPRPVVSDEALLSQIAGGDQEAFDDLYQRYSRLLYHYLFRLIGEPSEAEDLLQEVFMAVWRGAGGYRQRAQVKTWLYRIARNRAVSWLRQRKRLTAFEDLTQPSSEASLEEIVAEAYQNEQIRAAVNALPLKQREVLELAFVHHLSYVEIAQIIGCPEGTVKSRVSYAIRALKGVLSRMNFSP